MGFSKTLPFYKRSLKIPYSMYSVTTVIYVYMHIYIYTHLCGIYVYIYIMYIPMCNFAA